MKKRYGFGFRVVIAALIAIMVAGACAGGGGGGGGADVPQNLVVGAGEDGYELKGATANVGLYPLNANIFEGLVRMDADYNVVPVLATSWRFKAPNTWIFELREGVTFQDGQRFDAKAVKYTFDRIAKAGGGTSGFAEDSTKIIDDYTVAVTPSFPNKRMVEQLVHPENYIIAPGSNPGRKPVGTGPFQFIRYENKQEIMVERYDGYWGDKASLDQITFKFIPDPNARRLALEGGEIDLALEVPKEAVADLEAKGFVVSTSPPGAYEAMYANISGENGYTILQDTAVRQAIQYAIDRDALVNAVFEGLAAPEQTMIPARLLGSENAAKVQGYSYDPQRAEQLLEQAGWTAGGDGIRQKNGQALTLELVSGFPSAQVHGAVPEFVQGELEKVGIDVNIVKTPDEAAYTDRLNAGQGDLWLESGSQNDANPAFLPALLFWSKGLFGDIGYQPLFAPGGRFDRLVVQSLATPSEERVKSLVAEAMHVLIDQEAVVVPMAGLFRINVLSDKVQGFQPQPSGLQVQYSGVSMTE